MNDSNRDPFNPQDAKEIVTIILAAEIWDKRKDWTFKNPIAFPFIMADEAFKFAADALQDKNNEILSSYKAKMKAKGFDMSEGSISANPYEGGFLAGQPTSAFYITNGNDLIAVTFPTNCAMPEICGNFEPRYLANMFTTMYLTARKPFEGTKAHLEQMDIAELPRFLTPSEGIKTFWAKKTILSSTTFVDRAIPYLKAFHEIAKGGMAEITAKAEQDAISNVVLEVMAQMLEKTNSIVHGDPLGVPIPGASICRDDGFKS